ncbi:hypothetical protein ALT761_00536 [Alteromonas sp. 76-1]|jgi:hypothetical protein|nr:hypothetical protein ALT761_00536 [Alteromonas sp. 76-1]
MWHNLRGRYDGSNLTVIEPTCYCPRELATVYSGLLAADTSFNTSLMILLDLTNENGKGR